VTGQAEHFLLTRRTTVEECDRLSVIEPSLVGLNYSLVQIVESIESSPRTQTIAVVDEAGKLQGIIPVSQIVDDIFLEICPEEFLSDINDLGDAEDYALKTRLSSATTAAEMMLPPVFVQKGDTVVQAFRKMHKRDLRGLPIVDENKVVTGYLDWFEIMSTWLKAAKEKAGGKQ
jgi:CBS domain-containing protein